MSNSPLIVSGDAYLSLPREPQTWLIQSLIPSGGAVCLYGDPKVGKSYAALQLALAIEEGGEWLGFPVVRTGRVVYIQLDTPRSLWAERIEALRAGGVPSITKIAQCDRGTLDSWPFDILDPSHHARLKEALAEVKPIAVIVDTIRESHSADENDSTAMRNVIGELVDATQPAALIVISHARKPNPEVHRDLLADQRGSNYVVGRMDTIIRFTHRTAFLTGRAIEEGSVKLERLDNGFWLPLEDEVDRAIRDALADRTQSTRQRAKRVAERAGVSENAARMRLRRAEGGSKGGSKNDPPLTPTESTT